MLPELNKRIQEIEEQKRLKEKLQQTLKKLGVDLASETARLEQLSRTLEKEQVDVNRLEKTSLTALFYSVLGSREDQLQKERQELLAVQLHYQQCKHQLDNLRRERESILAQLQPLLNLQSEYQRVMVEKERILTQSNDPVARDLIEISTRCANLNADIKESGEAIAAGNEVVTGLDQVLDSLLRASNWGTWDMLGGGLLVTAAKHNAIDEAREGIHQVQSRLSSFRRELADVRASIDLRIDISDFESFADYIFDGLIADWVVQSRIDDSLDRARKARRAVDQAVEKLEGMKTNANNELRKWEEKRNDILASH